MLHSMQGIGLEAGKRRGEKMGRIRWMETAIPASPSWTVKRAMSQAGMRAARHRKVIRQSKEQGRGAGRNYFQQAQGPQKSQSKAKLIGRRTDRSALEGQPAE